MNLIDEMAHEAMEDKYFLNLLERTEKIYWQRILQVSDWASLTLSAMLLVFCVVLLCACQKKPDNKIVYNNDTESLLSTSSTTPVDQSIKYAETFYSTDKSIEFNLNINQFFPGYSFPVIEVIPHYLSSEDIERVAYALFGNAEFYEAQPENNPHYSQSQLQEKIRFWSQYSSVDALSNLYGDVGDNFTNEIDAIRYQIDYYTKLLEDASTENPHIRCDWSFKDESFYSETGGNNQVIYANVTNKDIEYLFTAITRNKDDYQLNGITAGLGEGLELSSIERRIYKAMLCRTEEPTVEQISNAAKRAQEMLDSMCLGDWTVVDSYTETTYYGECPEYTIRVEAVPTLNGIPVLEGQRILDIKSNDAYASSYYITSAFFQFSADGELVFFGMDAPIDIKDVINTNVATLSIDELVERVKIHLSHSDAAAGYGIPSGFFEIYEKYAGEELICKVEICELMYGLGRIKVRETEDSYYYLPVLACKGKANYYGKESGKLYISSSDFGDEIQDFLWLNAVDGSVIDG